MRRSPRNRFRSAAPRRRSAHTQQVARRRTFLGPLLLGVAVALVSSATISCSRPSGTVVVEDAGTAEQPGPRPTAPTGEGRPSSTTTAPTLPPGPLSVDDLVVQVDGLLAEDDLCSLLTGQALERLSATGFDTTGLVRDPAAIPKLTASLGRVYAHMAVIAPAPDVRADLEVLGGAWQAAAAVDPRAPDAPVRAAVLAADPAVQQSQADLSAWSRTNCTR